MTRLYAIVFAVVAACIIAVAHAEIVRVMPHGTVTIPQGQTSGTITVPIQGDTLVEPDESYDVGITSSAVQIQTSSARGTIINDDGAVAPIVSVSGVDAVRPGDPANMVITRSGDRAAADVVHWAVVPIGTAAANEDDFPAVLEDDFSGSSLGSEWCASDGTIDTAVSPAAGCPRIPEDPLLGTWDKDLVTVDSGNLSLGITYSAPDWTSAQVVSKRSFEGGLLRYAVTFPAGKGGAHAVWRAPADYFYGPAPRSGEIVDALYYGKTSADRNKIWLSQLQYSGADDTSAPAIAGQLNNGTVWSGTSRAASTRWVTDAAGVTRFAFSVGTTTYWQPVQGDWPTTKPWTFVTIDEDGNPITIDYPGGGEASPFDQPFRIVLQSGVGPSTSIACTGETSCPDTTALNGAAVTFDYVRYYQYPHGQTVMQPGQDQVTVPIITRDAGVTGVRSFRFVLVSADQAMVSSTAGSADVSLDPAADPGVNHGQETYFLDFGKNAGGFMDQYGRTWDNGNSYVTGGTAISDSDSGGIGSWTSDLESPPSMSISPVTYTDVCPEDPGWPSDTAIAGKDVKIVFPTDRDCEPDVGAGGKLQTKIGGTDANPVHNLWTVGGKIVNVHGQGNPGTDLGSAGLALHNISGTAFIEGAHIDMDCTCEDAVNSLSMGPAGSGSNPGTGVMPAGQSPRVVIQNSIMEGPMQCQGGTHGDIFQNQGTGKLVEYKAQNVYMVPGFQGIWGDPRVKGDPAGPVGHGLAKLDLDHVLVKQNPNCNRIPTPGTSYKFVWQYTKTIAPEGVSFNSVNIDMPQEYTGGNTTSPNPTGYDSSGCAVYPASANVNSGTWCKGQPANGNPVSPDLVGRNYDRTTFTSGTPVVITGAAVPRLDLTRLVGSAMDIAVPVNTTRGRQRYVTLGFSARDESAAGARVFSISGAIVNPSFDIFASAGARDTETVITAPVTVSSDGYLRLTLTGLTGQAQINWMTISRPTVSIALDKAAYTEGDHGTITLEREGPTEPAISMGWQIRGVGSSPTSPTDFTPAGPNGTASFPSGVTSVTVPFAVVADGSAEPEETFQAALTGGVGADINVQRSKASATIAPSSGTVDPCSPGGSQYPCTTPTDECHPDGAVQKTMYLSNGAAINVRKTGLVQGVGAGRGRMRALNTKCTKSDVVYGDKPATDPKGLQADTIATGHTPYVRIDPLGKFPLLLPGKRATDTFTYQVCEAPLMDVCTPVVMNMVITGE